MRYIRLEALIDWQVTLVAEPYARVFEFEGGDVSYPVWVGGYWRDGEVPPDVGAAVKVIVTKAPVELKFDDDQESLTITDSNGNTVSLDSSGITLSRGGSTVAVSDSSVSVNDSALEVQS